MTEQSLTLRGGRGGGRTPPGGDFLFFESSPRRDRVRRRCNCFSPASLERGLDPAFSPWQAAACPPPPPPRRSATYSPSPSSLAPSPLAPPNSSTVAPTHSWKTVPSAARSRAVSDLLHRLFPQVPPPPDKQGN